MYSAILQLITFKFKFITILSFNRYIIYALHYIFMCFKSLYLIVGTYYTYRFMIYRHYNNSTYYNLPSIFLFKKISIKI